MIPYRYFAGKEDKATQGCDLSALSDLRGAVYGTPPLFLLPPGNKGEKPRGSGQSPDSSSLGNTFGQRIDARHYIIIVLLGRQLV